MQMTIGGTLVVFGTFLMVLALYQEPVDIARVLSAAGLGLVGVGMTVCLAFPDPDE